MIHPPMPKVLVLLSLCSCLTGCASVAPTPMSFSMRRVVTPDSDSVFQTVRSTLIDRGYRIDTAEAQSGRITTYPIDVVDSESSRGVGASRAQRRLVDVRISREGESTSVYCRVLRLRQTTEAHRLLAVDQGADDLPGRTPIEREAATGRRQNTVWETVGRNKPHERAILSDILDRLDTAPRPDR